MDVIVMHKTTEKMPLVITTDQVDQIKKHADNVHWFETEAEVLASGVDAEVIFCWGGTGIPPETFCCQSKRLKWLNTFSAGVDPLVKSKIADLPITVTTAKGVHGRSMALTTLGYCIWHLRKFAEMRENQRNHVFKKLQGQEAIGKTLGIVGAGSIGSYVAQLSKAVGFKVIGVKRTVTQLENFDEMYSDKELDKALALMDFVVVLTPMSKETAGMFDESRFACMKKGAFFVNIARGGVVDQDALVRALKSGHLSGAALDATDPEPLPDDHVLWDMPNVFVTPHNSATSPFLVDRAVDQFCENLDNFRAGRPLFNIVDLKSL
ncbi:MAG: D-2-hydroxyacid dehydrogenase [Oscillospiraceae bacterium]|nr:D-2-hydroxyacid dehydrogenase [Oscillospiraceae bacterium]